jgi:hypothetical protein
LLSYIINIINIKRGENLWLLKSNLYLPAPIVGIKRQRPCLLMPASSSMTAKDAVCYFGPEITTAAYFALMEMFLVHLSKEHRHKRGNPVAAVE